MAIYLLDFENVHDSGIVGITSLTENDELFIFYSVKSEHMSFETHVNIMKTAAKVRYIKLMRAAKNYLDFQLCTHLGYIIGAGMEGPFYIISKDTGYDSAIDYWKDHGVTIIRQPSIGFNRNSGKSTGQNPAHKTPPALVTFKQGSQVTSPDVSELFLIDTGRAPSDTDYAVSEECMSSSEEPDKERAEETSALLPEADLTEIMEDSTAAEQNNAKASADASADAKPSGGRTRQSRSRKSSSKKTTTAKETDASDTAIPASDTPESASAELSEADAEKDTTKPIKSAAKKSSGKAVKKAAKQDKAAVEKTTENQEKAAESQDKTAVSGNISAERITVEEVKAETAEAAISTASESNADQAEAKPETLPESYRKRVRTALKGKSIPSAYYSSIYKAIINSYDKLALNNLLVKTFGSSRGGEVYKSIKDVFIDFQS